MAFGFRVVIAVSGRHCSEILTEDSASKQLLLN